MEPDPASVRERVKSKLKMRLLDVLDAARDNGHTNAGREEIEGHLRTALRMLTPEEARVLSPSRDAEERLIREIISEVSSLGPLDDLLSDPGITEIMVNGPHEIFVERKGRLSRVQATFRDAQHVRMVIERILSPVGLTVNESEPICDAHLPDGSRINVVIAPLALNGPCMTIRRKARGWTMAELVAIGTLSEQAAEFLTACIRAKVNLIISGGSSTGKTTLVGILSQAIPSDQRVVLIENVPELELAGDKHCVRLVAKSANLEGRGEIPLRTLVGNALRMRPDRIVLGEARGGEALDVVQAMHAGHDGVITVLHANTPRAALERLATLMLMSGLELPPGACRIQIGGTVELVVHMGRFADGSRRVAAISQVAGVAQEGFDMEELFVFNPQGFSQDGKLLGECRYTGARPRFLSKFLLNNVAVPSWVRT